MRVVRQNLQEKPFLALVLSGTSENTFFLLFSCHILRNGFWGVHEAEDSMWDFTWIPHCLTPSWFLTKWCHFGFGDVFKSFRFSSFCRNLEFYQGTSDLKIRSTNKWWIMEGKGFFHHFNQEKIIWYLSVISQISMPAGSECQRIGSMEIMEIKWFEWCKSQVLKSRWSSKSLIPQMVHVGIQ